MELNSAGQFAPVFGGQYAPVFPARVAYNEEGIIHKYFLFL